MKRGLTHGVLCPNTKILLDRARVSSIEKGEIFMVKLSGKKDSTLFWGIIFILGYCAYPLFLLSLKPNYLFMKKFLVLIITGCLLVPALHAQDGKDQPQSFGVSFFLNDFTTAANIRTTSLNTVLNQKTFGKIGEMSAGFAVNYFKQMRPRISSSAYLGVSSMRYPMPGRTITKGSMLVELSASLNLMMTTDEYYVQPYLMLGVGGHKFGPHYGVFLPAGLGVKFNIFEEANVFLTTSYRVPVSTETANYHFQHAIGVAAPLHGKKK